jgi:hypothetical protein
MVYEEDTINSLSQNIENQITAMRNEYDKQQIYWEEKGIDVRPEFYKIKETCEKLWLMWS